MIHLTFFIRPSSLAYFLDLLFLLVTVTVPSVLSIYIFIYADCLQCFDTVGWAAGRASGL